MEFRSVGMYLERRCPKSELPTEKVWKRHQPDDAELVETRHECGLQGALDHTLQGLPSAGPNCQQHLQLCLFCTGGE